MRMQRVEVPYIPARKLVLWTLGVAAVVLCFWLLIRFHFVLLLLLATVILSTAVRPGVLWLEKRGIAKPLGILLIYAAIGLLLGLLFWYTVPVLAEQSTAMRQSLSDGYQLLRQNLMRLPNILVRRLLIIMPSELPTLTPTGAETAVTQSDLPLTDTLAQAQRLLRGVFYFVILAMLIFYWTLEQERLKQAAFLLVPLKSRDSARELVREIEGKVSGYLLGQGLLCLIIGVLAFISYLIIGLPHALLLAIFAGLLEAVPILGPFLGAVPAIVVALSISPLTALWVVLASVLIQQLENAFLVPRVMSRTIGVRPLVTLLSLLAFGSFFGILGALIALPLAAIIQLLFDHFLLTEESLEDVEPGRDRLSVLRYETGQLLQDIHSQMRKKDDEPSAKADALEDEVEAIAVDLESFLTGLGDGQA